MTLRERDRYLLKMQDVDIYMTGDEMSEMQCQ